MVETLGELNKVCQKPRYRETGNWMVRHILRDAALPITWLLLHTKVTANQVTVFSLVTGLCGIGLLALPSSGFFLAGCLLLQAWYLLDHVDGQIARYRKTSCLSGRFFDFMTHHLIHVPIFFSLGVHAFQVTGSFFFVLWGFATSMAGMVFNLIHDAKCKTFVEALPDGHSFKINKPESSGIKPKKKERGSIFENLFSFCHKIFEVHVLMNLLTFSALMEMCLVPLDFRLLYVFVYGFTLPVIGLAKTVVLISGRRIDRDYHTIFRDLEARGG